MPETIRIPAREGHAVRMSAGDRIRVIDPEGGQVADVFAFCADDLSEYHSAEHTRVYVNRLFPRVGQQFVTNRRRPILTLEADTSPGIHDMLCAACDPSRYAGLGVEGWHASCQENLQKAMAALGYEGIEIPQPINVFMNIPVLDDWEIGLGAGADEGRRLGHAARGARHRLRRLGLPAGPRQHQRRQPRRRSTSSCNSARRMPPPYASAA